MIVHHADSLHEGIDDGRSTELETAARELFGHPLGDRGLGGNLFRAPVAVDLRSTVDKVPQQSCEAWSFIHDVEPGACRRYGAFDFRAVANNALVLHQALDLLGRITSNLVRLEFAEGSPKVLALAQDGDPGQPSLETVEHELLIERAIIKLRNAPFIVVVGDVERVELWPRTACQTVGVRQCNAHSAALDVPGIAKRAQDALSG